MTDGAPPDPLIPLLDRIRLHFGVAAASLRLIGEDGRAEEIVAGVRLPGCGTPPMLRLRALAASDLVVVPAVDHGSDAAGHADAAPRFYAGIPIAARGGRPLGTLDLFHTRPRLLPPAKLRFLEELAEALGPLLARRREAAADLRRRLGARALEAARATFELASAGTGIGVWECALRDESLSWTDQVYALFEIPRGAVLLREKILECYTLPSLDLLTRERDAAIAARRGFRLDAEIVTMKGRRRWIRIDAGIECRDGAPLRLVGMKRDVTEERRQLDDLRRLAWADALTGLANRARFQMRLDDLGAGRAAVGALLLVDLDGFKPINDRFGHAAGDACLKATAERLAALCRAADLVARIGGDEFAVLLGPGAWAVETLAGAIVAALAQPIACDGRSLRLGASVGIAHVEPEDGGPGLPDALFRRADTALYAAKAAGRGTFRIFAREAMGHGGAPDPGRPAMRRVAAL